MTPSHPPARQPDSGPEAPSPLLTPVPQDVPADTAGSVAPPEPASTELGGLLAQWSPGDWLAYGSLVLLAFLLTVIAVTTLWWMLYAWRSRDSLQRTGFAASTRESAHSFTLLVPARHEEEVLGQTLDRLVQQDHPHFEIIAIVGHDDPGTELVAREAAARHSGLIEVVVDSSVPKNKPKALNLALERAHGSVVGVFDAEDEVHPRLLSLVDSRFTETDADVVQGGVQLMNFETSWWSLRNVLEYYFWFRSRLHFHASAKFIPLGGNTVFVKRGWLDWSNGWDAGCLAEGCELGVRLSSQHAKVVVAYSPEVVTREVTPGSLKSLFKQRTRWNQGFLQVLGKGEWRHLPNWRQRFFARYILAMPFLQALTGILIPVSLVLILFAEVPVVIALISFLPLAPTIVTLTVEIAGLNEFGRLYGRRVRPLDYLRLVLGTFPYQVFLALAAVCAAYRQARGRNRWGKTEHTGGHRPAQVMGPKTQPSQAVMRP